jgi:homoserine kinase
MKKITIQSPATIANLVCGFDVLGLALEAPYDVMTLELQEQPGLLIEHSDGFGLPTIPEENVAGAALLAMLEQVTDAPGMKLTIDKRIMPGSGLGSSAASAAGAVFAANQLLGKNFSTNDLIRFAMFGEKVASGVKHADNITPCLLGGVTLIRSILPLDVVSLDAPAMFITVVHPQIEVRTADARSILKQQILLKDAIKQWGNIAGLVAGLQQGDYDLIGRSLEDVLIEPTRSILIPAFDRVKLISKELGALGGGISGSGPSIFMLSKTEHTAKAVQLAMNQIYDSIGLSCHTYVTTINTNGIQLMDAS